MSLSGTGNESAAPHSPQEGPHSPSGRPPPMKGQPGIGKKKTPVVVEDFSKDEHCGRLFFQEVSQHPFPVLQEQLRDPVAVRLFPLHLVNLSTVKAQDLRGGIPQKDW